MPPRSNFSDADIQWLIDQLPQPFFTLGDFDAHNLLWGGHTLDNEGKITEDIINNNDIVLLNDGTMTYHNIYFNSYSAIVLSVCSSAIALDFIWSVNEFWNSSDHYPILLKYARNTPTGMPQGWKPLEAEWEKYKKEIKLDKECESFNNHIKAKHCFSQCRILYSKNYWQAKETNFSMVGRKMCHLKKNYQMLQEVPIKWHSHC